MNRRRLLSALSIALFVGTGAACVTYSAPDMSDTEHSAVVHQNHHIDFVEIPTTDMAKSQAFYREVFGWSFVDYGPDYADIKGAGLSGGLRPVTEPPPRGGSMVVVFATDLESTLARVEAAGGRVEGEILSFPGGRRFHFVDPTGSELAVWSDK